jgi:hypothetical protein
LRMAHLPSACALQGSSWSCGELIPYRLTKKVHRRHREWQRQVRTLYQVEACLNHAYTPKLSHSSIQILSWPEYISRRVALIQIEEESPC